ncbi:tetraspanin-33-like [Amphiura filiformis]|uniref:tetraspanin-33-like n=1 Tax=Amphiura filiformis TaxID=82378 RepID=UPI003B20E3EF
MPDMTDGELLDKFTTPCIKYTLYVFNFLFWLVSLFVLAVGIWALVERNQVTNVNSYVEFFTDPAIVMVVVGSVAFILTFTGFLGALRQNCCLLTFFYLFLLLIFILEIVAGILAFVYSGEFYQAVDNIIEESIMEYRFDGDLTNFIDFAQRELECCGGDKGYQDWNLNRYFKCDDPDNISIDKCGVPYSCCREGSGTGDIINTQCGHGVQELSSVEAANIVYTSGCADKLLSEINMKSYIVGITVFGIAAIQLGGMVLAFIMCRQIEQEQWRYEECKKRGLETCPKHKHRR